MESHFGIFDSLRIKKSPLAKEPSGTLKTLSPRSVDPLQRVLVDSMHRPKQSNNRYP